MPDIDKAIEIYLVAVRDAITKESLPLEKLVKALQTIVNPVQYLTDKAKEEGGELNGAMAFMLVNNANWLREIAEDALSEYEKIKK